MKTRTLRIWEADCGLFDAVLTLSFDTGELLNALQSAEIPVPHCGCVARPAAVVGTVHRACHSETPLALLIERRLNLVHAEALRELEREGFAWVRNELVHTDLRHVERLAGRLWALTVCAEPGAAAARTAASALLTMTGLRLIAAQREVA